MVQTFAQASLAIPYRHKRILLQLRDNNSGITYPGQWALFGGRLELEETPEDALFRELQEEINYVPPSVALFRVYHSTAMVRHIYFVPLNVDIEELTLNEGADMDLLTPVQIQSGKHFSVRKKLVRPLGRPHQQILLDFLKEYERCFIS